MSTPKPSKETKQMLQALEAAVTKALDKKKRLGQYAVVCRDGKPKFIGENPPSRPE